MAANDYSINVTAKIDVQQLKKSIRESINGQTISIKPNFTASIDDSNIKKLKNTIANYINKETISIENFSVNESKAEQSFQQISAKLSKKLNLTANVGISQNSFQKFTEDTKAIQSYLEDIKSKSKIAISFDLDQQTFEQFTKFTNNLKELPETIARISFNQEDIIGMTKQIVSLNDLKTYLDQNSFNINFETSGEDLSNIKNNIENYFKENPVVITISQDINDVDLGTVSEKVAELLKIQTQTTTEETEKQKTAVKNAIEEITQERVKASENRKQQEEQNAKESQQRIQDLVSAEKEASHQRIENQTQELRDRGQALLELANQTKETASNTMVEIQQLEKDAVDELRHVIEESNASTLYKEETDRLLTLYKQNAIDFEQFHNDIIEKMKQAQESGLISDDVINKTADKLHDIEIAHQQSLEKQQEQEEKARQQKQEKDAQAYEKEVQENRKHLENLAKQQSKYNEDLFKKKEEAWNNEVKNIQDRYNKELISTEEYVSRMQTLLPEAFENGYKNAQHYANALEQVQQEQDKTANSAQNLSSGFDNMFNSLMRYFGVTKIFNAVQTSFSKMIDEVKDLDVELTEFSKVSDLSAQETEKFIDSAYRLGETVAKTGTDVVQATTMFKKMGYDVEESMKFAEDALMWTNVADGMVSVDEASNMLISTMKAFEKEGLTSTHIIDALNEVSNNYSTSSSALSNNLSTVAATLAVSNTSFEETVGLMTAGIEVMPDKASKVANGLKTISQRIRQIDGDTAEKLDEFLGSKGISRFDEVTGQLKGTYDILKEISEKWNDWSDNERQYIGEVMAGKNQITVLNAVMMNFKTAIEATQTAMDSAGSAAKENERVLESIQGHINALKSAFGELARDLISSDLMKDVIDFGTNLIKWLDNLIKNHLPALINGISAVGAAIASLHLVKVTSDFTKFIASLGSAGPIALGAAAVIAVITAAVVDFIQKTNEANRQFDNFVELGSRGLSSEKTSIEKSLERYKELHKLLQEEQDLEKRQEYASELAEIQSSLKDIGVNVDLINGNYDQQIDKLKQVLELQQEIELHNKQEEFKSSQDKNLVADIVKDNQQAFGIGTGFLDFSTPGEFQKAIDTIYNLNIGGNTLKSILDDSTRSIQDKQQILRDSYLEYQEQAKYYGQLAEEATSEETKSFYESQQQQTLAYAGIIYQIFESLGEQGEKYNDVIDAASDVVKTKLERFGVDLSKFTVEQLESFKQAIESGDLWQINIPLDELGISFQDLKNIINDPDLKEGLIHLIGEEQTNKMASGLANVGASVEDTGVSLSGAMAMMSDYVSNMELLNQAHMEFVDNGEISADTLQKIANAGLEAYLIIDEETKSLDVNRDAFIDNNKSIEDNAIASYVAGQRTKLLSELKNEDATASNNSANASDNQKIAVEKLTTALENVTDETSAAAAAQLLLNQAQTEGITVTDANGAVLDSIKSKVTAFVSETKAGIEALHTLFNTASTSSGRTGTTHSTSHGSGSRGSSSSSSSSSSNRAAQQAQREAKQAAKKAENEWKNGFDVLYKQLKTYLDAGQITTEEYYDALEKLNEKFFKGRAEFEEEYWKYEDEILKGRKKYYEDELSNYFKKGESLLSYQLNTDQITEEQYYQSLTTLYQSYYTDKEKYEEEYWKLQEDIYKYQKKKREDDIKDIKQQIEDLYDEAEKRHKQYIESLKQDSDEIQTSISYAVDVLDEEINKLKAEKSALDESNEALKEQIKLQELEEALEKAKQKKIRVYRKGQGFVYEQDTKAVSEAQSAIDEYKSELAHKKEVSMIDEKIRKLEELRDAWKNIPETYKKVQAEIVALQRMGSDAQQKILSGDLEFIQDFATAYNTVQDDIKAANAMSVEDMVAYYDDIATEVDRLNAKLKTIESIKITISQTTTNTFNTIINNIDSIKEKLEQSYSATGITNFAKTFNKKIDSMISKIQAFEDELEDSGIDIDDIIDDDEGGGGGGGSGGGTQGPPVGASVKIKPEYQDEFYYGTHDFKVWGYNWEGDVQIISTQATDTSAPTYAVPVEYLVGYASGTLGTKSNVFKVNENGVEAMVTPNGTVISAPSSGYGVIKNRYTERLTDFASDPLGFLNKAFTGYSGNYQNNNSSNEIININGDLNLPNVTDGQSFVDSIRNIALQYTTRRR